MKTFELSKKVSKNGRRHFKAILCEIYPDSCVDEVNGVANEYNTNGISWIREYCENALPTIKGMSLRCEFLDSERTILNGHGETEIKDGLPLFENAELIGYFENGYITDIETDEGVKTVCIGEGTIDGLCYHSFCEKLEQEIENGNAPQGSVEILKTGDNPTIIYKYGYKDFGRIPMVFEFSGYALLGVEPADQTAKILELNNNVNEEENAMGENEIKAIVTQVVSEMNSAADEINKIREECEKRVEETQAIANEFQSEVNQLNETIADLESKISALNEANAALTSEKESLSSEVNQLKGSLEEAQKKEKIGELNAAINEFTDEQKAYAQAEIDAFNENPLTSEINSVVNKIHAEIGKKYMEEAKKASENDEVEVEDIFSEINEKKVSEEDVDIF
jgi:hypothetical protein